MRSKKILKSKVWVYFCQILGLDIKSSFETRQLFAEHAVSLKNSLIKIVDIKWWYRIWKKSTVLKGSIGVVDADGALPRSSLLLSAHLQLLAVLIENNSSVPLPNMSPLSPGHFTLSFSETEPSHEHLEGQFLWRDTICHESWAFWHILAAYVKNTGHDCFPHGPLLRVVFAVSTLEG